MQYSPDGNTLATITGDRRARLWSVANGTYLRTLANGTNSVSFSPDSTLLATGRTNEGIEVWGVEDGASIQAQSAGDGDMLVTFSPNGSTLASASWYGLLSLGSITGATSTSSWYGHADAVSSLAFSPDGTRLASAAMDGSLKLWQVSDQTLLGSIEGHSSNLTSMTLTRDGTYLAAGFERGTIQIRFPTNGAIWQSWVDPVIQDAAIIDLEYSPTGTTLVSVSSFYEGDYQYFYGGEGRLWNPSDGTMLGSLPQYGISAAFSPNGQALMFGNYLFSPDGDLLDQLETHTNWGEPRSMDISPDGSILAVGYSLNDVRLFRTSDLELLRTLTHATQDRYYTEVGCVAFSPDGTILASGSEDQIIRLWRVSDRTLLRVLTGHAGNITSLAFSPDGTMLVSGSADRTVHLWRVGDGALLHTLSGHTFQVSAVAFSPDSTLLFSASLDGTVHVWGLFVSWRQDR